MARLRKGFGEKMLNDYPRGASRARDDRYEVSLPIVPAGTPSARAEAPLWQVKCWLQGRLRSLPMTSG